MPKTPEQKSFDVKLTEQQREDLGRWLCNEIQNADAARPIPVEEVRYWWKLYEQARTRGSNAPWQDAADLTSYIPCEKVDAMKARAMRTVWVDPVWTVEGWGESAQKAPFVEDFHQWAQESESLQTYLSRVFHAALIEIRGVLEVFEDTTERVIRRTINAAVATQPDPMTGMPTWVMSEDMEPVLLKDEDGNYVEVFDAMTPSASVTIDEVQRVRKGPGYRVLPYEDFLVLPAHAREKADIWGYAKRFHRRLDQLVEAAKNGTYDAQAVEALNETPDKTSDLTVSGEARAVSEQTKDKVEKELWEIQLLHNLDKKGLRWYVITVHVPTFTVLRVKYDDINKGRFILFVPFPRTDRAHEGYSFVGHKLITVTEEHTAWRNMGADRAALEVAAPIKRLTTALWDPDLQPFGPKATIDVRDMREIEPMQIPAMTDAALRREQETIQASERIAGINDIALGQQSQQNQTLGEIEIRTEQSFVRMDEMIRNLQEPLEALGEIRNAIWIRAIRENEAKGGTYAPAYVFEGLDEKGGDPCKDGKITAEMLEGTFRFKPRGSTETADKSKQRGDYIQFLQSLGLLFQTWPLMAQTVGMNPQAAMSAIEQALRLFNIPDKQAWIGPIKQMMQQQMMSPPGMPPMGMMPPGMGMPPGLPPGMPGMPPGGAPPGGPPQGPPPQGPMNG